MDRLKNKRALITGGNTGIGLETARQFLSEGARVAVTGTNPATLEAARKELGGDVTGGRVSTGSGRAASARKAIGECFGQLDIMFVNAGIATCGPWRTGTNRHLTGRSELIRRAVLLLQALLRLFANGASVVLNTSINAHIGMPNTTIYAASKASAAVADEDALGRVDRPRYPGEFRNQSRSDRDAATSKVGMSEAQLKAAKAGLTRSDSPRALRHDPPKLRRPCLLASDEAEFTVGSELVIDGGIDHSLVPVEKRWIRGAAHSIDNSFGRFVPLANTSASLMLFYSEPALTHGGFRLTEHQAVYLARHGETAWSLTGQHTGLTDLPLTARGECNSRRLGERLEGLQFAQGIHQPVATRDADVRAGRLWRAGGSRSGPGRMALRRV